MQITEVNTLGALREVLESEESRQDDLFRERVMEPLRPVWENMLRFIPGQAGAGDPALTAARMMRLYLPEMGRERGLEALGRLERARVREENLGALRRAAGALRPDEHGARLSEVHLALTLADPEGLGEEGYTGAGNTPGWVMVSVWPKEHNLSRLPAVTAHEFNHNVRFGQPDWTFPIPLGAYLVAEGLAETFAAELFGPESLGLWTTTLGMEELGPLRPRFQAALHEQDFNVVRGYIFGDSVMRQSGQANGGGGPGLPPYAGYALGYHVVRDYLARTGRTAAQATYDPWRQIVNGSGWFTA
ncbi:hypothetical protein DAETH_11170 [Deinococcus aetherius]|uniref:DUF2268 domain-containing protein n=1 Tax=Deinococcus aetherius TaxID=200252 RepID=A0ABN6REP7_9DEIO|nr:DUF2268 domain-containing protein [Deinococcus aetherius]BDP41148.1 hypothetical protein DAETH_11170 [Deinococcus aetherius]